MTFLQDLFQTSCRLAIIYGDIVLWTKVLRWTDGPILPSSDTTINGTRKSIILVTALNLIL